MSIKFSPLLDVDAQWNIDLQLPNEIECIQWIMYSDLDEIPMCLYWDIHIVIKVCSPFIAIEWSQQFGISIA